MIEPTSGGEARVPFGATQSGQIASRLSRAGVMIEPTSGGETRVPFGATQTGRIASRLSRARIPGLN